MSALIELSGIFKSYGTKENPVPVLKDISFTMQEGEYIAIMGPSGSGKSTLMNIIGCLDHFDEGSYHLDGQDISSMNNKQLADVRLHKIGFVFQNFQLLAEETALGNTALPLVYAGVNKKEREERAKQLLEEVGLGDRMNFYPSQLSGGQKQRVAIARALINHPRILLADEPTGALDQTSGQQIMDLFQRLHERGDTVLMITHDADVASHAQRTVHIIDGRLTDGGKENHG